MFNQHEVKAGWDQTSDILRPESTLFKGICVVRDQEFFFHTSGTGDQKFESKNGFSDGKI